MSEHEEQAALVDWARARYAMGVNELKWLMAVPNGAKLPFGRSRKGGRFAPQAYRLIAEGLKPGVADLFLPVPRHSFCGLWVEMKFGNNRLQENQGEFLQDMNDAGYLAVACWGADQAILTVSSYLGIPTR